MKPRNKFQEKIIALSEKLPGLTEDQVDYLREELFDHKATILKSGKVSCLDCGHQWQSKDLLLANLILGATCPSCKRELKVEQTQKKVFHQGTYYQVIDTFKGYQLIRLYEARKYFKAGQPMQFSYNKVYENWITKEGKTQAVGMFITSKWNDGWGGDYELRSNRSSTQYDIRIKDKYIYPKKKFIPTLKRNGLKTSMHGLNPFYLFLGLLKDSKAETLMKAKQYSLLNQLIMDARGFKDYWPSVKICMRNNYIIKDASTWLDYLRFLNSYGKDLRNPKYVCPEDLDKQHNKYVEKERRRREKEREQMKIKQLAKQLKREAKMEKEYAKKKGKFIGLELSDDTYNARFLNNIQEFKEEGDAMRHCVFSREYFREPSLLFSIRKKGKHIATAEVSIKTWRVLQVRTKHNVQSPETKEISAFITENFKVIKDRMKPKKRKKKPQLAMAS